ncbi:hypothetical protein GCM10011360_19680 [Primorskyibacter flagellatus]|uniref:VPLPA-CTERM protein sorting domain-containing protein n=1 Tax=Primorskyibacter flagellatus TaxID=1387277 RepID=A0A917A8Y3_9RHOB|nr:VPLPA-CTERM sorting domain-containing protein [Primorskyibacter flagellatus]GGE31813.1 hypothetical protein GCM10011360_19680 [Primorskyibacter flagellatus]
MNQQSGSHLRDFIFHVTQDSSTGALLVGGSNNTDFIPKESIEAGNHYTVTTSGWYVFEHSFYDLGGSLAVDLNLYDSASNLLFTETRNNPGDLMASVVGGNRYGWFTSVEVGGDLYVDAVSMDVTAPAVPLPAGLPLMIGAFAGFGLLARRRRD